MPVGAAVALGPVVGGILGDAFGFRESFWITGIILAIAGICVWLWVHEEFTPVEKAKQPSLVESYRVLLVSPGMFGLYTLAFLRSLGQMMIYPVAALFMIELMGTEIGAATASGLMIGAVGGASAISSVYLGQLGDRIGHERILIAAALCAVLFYLPQPFVTAPWQLIILQGLTGFAAGGLLSPMAALMNLWTPPNTQGATYALDNSVAAAGRSISPMVAAGVATWIGVRGVFGITAIVYAVIAAQVLWMAQGMRERRAAQEQQAQLATGD